MTPLLSIIIPVFNTEKYIDNCIQSILCQLFQDWELIIIDDGSTDQSGEICDMYAKLDNRIIVIHTENRGQSAARNRGMDIAKGKYITFVDSDDELTPETYSENIEILLDNPTLEVIQFPTFEGYPDGVLSFFPEKQYETNRDIQLAFLEHLPHFTAAPWNKIYKANVLDSTRFIEGRLHEDYMFIDQLVQQINSFRISNKGCYHYYHRPSSTTHTQKISRFLDLLDCDISRLNRRYAFPELHHLIIEQYVFVVREWQNIRFEFPNDDMTQSYQTIKKLRPKLRYLFKDFTLRYFCWYSTISILGLNPFTKLYQFLLKKQHRL